MAARLLELALQAPLGAQLAVPVELVKVLWPAPVPWLVTRCCKAEEMEMPKKLLRRIRRPVIQGIGGNRIKILMTLLIKEAKEEIVEVVWAETVVEVAVVIGVIGSDEAAAVLGFRYDSAGVTIS